MEPPADPFELKLDELSKTMSENSEVWNQFAGSGIANLLTMLAVGLIMGMRKLCDRESKCKSHVHCCCLDLDVRDRTMRERPDNTDEGQDIPV